MKSISCAKTNIYNRLPLIIAKKEIGPKIKLIKVLSPLISAKSKPGHFVILRVTKHGERIPLTIADNDVDKGSITMVFLEIGKTTTDLGKLDEGENIVDLVGPLGNSADIQNFGRTVLVGGGVGAAAIYPEAKALKNAGNYVISVIGARDRNLLVFEDEIRKVSDEFYISTDNGSKGQKGFVTDVVKDLIENHKPINRVIAIGPTIMMKAVSDTTKPHNIETIVSLNPIMVDGTGMCGSCRVSVGGETKFACVDGPEFNAHKVDFNLLFSRLKMYRNKELMSLEHVNGPCLT